MRRLIVTAAGLLVACLLLLAPATAQANVTVAGNYGVTAGSAIATTSLDGNTTTVEIGAGRTVLDFDGFNLTPGRTLQFVFADRDDTVLIRTQGIATVNGVLNATMGTGGPYGGNVWLAGRSGVVFGNNAVVNIGGLHATTANVENGDFADTDQTGTGRSHAFTGALAGTQVQAAAQITGHGGPLLIAGSRITSDATSAIGNGTNPDTEVAYAAARDYEMTIGSTFSGDQELLELVPTGSVPATGAPQMDLNGATTAGDVFVVSQGSDAVMLSGSLTAHRFLASGGGDIVIATGGGMTRPNATAAPTATREEDAPAQQLVLRNTASAQDVLLARTTGDLTLSPAVPSFSPGGRAVSTFHDVVLSTEEDFVNQRGPDAVSVNSSRRFLIYAADPDTSTFGGVNSGDHARWGATIETFPPSTATTGHKYVFAFSPTVTFSAPDLEREWPVPQNEIYAEFDGYEGEPASGAYWGDQPENAFTGDPVVSSAGIGTTALVNDEPADASDGPYAIVVGQGTLVPQPGYQLALENGSLDVRPQAGDDNRPTVTHDVAGQEGENGWFTSDVAVTFSASDPDEPGATLEKSPDCDGRSVTADGPGVAFTCTVVNRGRRRVATTPTIKRDTTPPMIDTTAMSRGFEYTVGEVATDDVVVSFTCIDETSGVASDPMPDVTVTDEGDNGSVTSTGECVDEAGHAAEAVDFGPIVIDKTPPVISASATSGGDPYTPGAVASDDVVVSFSCTDTGSGVSSDLVPDVTVTAEGVTDSVTSTGECIDNAGHEADPATFGPIEIDRTPPVITASATSGGEPYTEGAVAADDVVVHFSCTDAGSGVATDTVPDRTVIAEGVTESVTSTGTCADEAGHDADPVDFGPIEVDKTPPVITASATSNGQPYSPNVVVANDVVVSFSCTDAGSGVATDTVPDVTVTAEGVTSSVPSTGTCEDEAGHEAQAVGFGPVHIDKSPPVIMVTAMSGDEPYTAGEVAAGDVVVDFWCTDAMSGISVDTLTDVTVTAEGTTDSVTSTGECVDDAGHEAGPAAFGPIKIDRNDPPDDDEEDHTPPANQDHTPPGSGNADTAGTSSTDGAGTQQTTTPASGPSALATRTLLVHQAVAAAAVVRKLGLARLVTRGYSRAFSADQAGAVTEELLAPAPRRGRARSAKSRAVVLATGTARFAAAGKKRIRVRVTKAGRRVLRDKRTLELTVRTTFRPASGPAIRVQRAATVRRR